MEGRNRSVKKNMEIKIEPYTIEDLAEIKNIWNEVVEEGNAFPQMDCLTEETTKEFFEKQDYVGVAKVDGKIEGLYILHPNNVGRCGHHANASYAVRAKVRGKKIGERLVKDSLLRAKELNYQLLIFNAVVKGNNRAIALYSKLGFQKVGEIPNGFLLKDGSYQDTIIFYHIL